MWQFPVELFTHKTGFTVFSTNHQPKRSWVTDVHLSAARYAGSDWFKHRFERQRTRTKHCCANMPSRPAVLKLQGLNFHSDRRDIFINIFLLHWAEWGLLTYSFLRSLISLFLKFFHFAEIKLNKIKTSLPQLSPHVIKVLPFAEVWRKNRVSFSGIG